MRIGIPKETGGGQTLVAGTPDTVVKLQKLGYDVVVEAGAGEAASIEDAQYEAAGAAIVDRAGAWGADMVTCLNAPDEAALGLVREGAVVVARMNPGGNPDLVDALAHKGATALALDMVPRISRAQALDVRSSMMNVAGNRAVIEAANAFGRLFGGQVTAAGKVNPAKVYVIGVGVAGLAAIGAAGAMGAQVFASDVRAEVADQVESLGATFVEIPVVQESSDGYAKALTDEQQNKVLEVYAKQAAECDIVITTAQVPGRPAPLLLTAEAIRSMKPGSVVVDMGASELGSNSELTRPNESYTTENGVTIIGYEDLPSRMPGLASQLFGQNIVNLMKLVTKEKNGTPVFDMDDEVVRGMTATLDGAIMWPPPPVNVSAAPKETAPEPVAAEAASEPEKSAFEKHWWKVLVGILAVALVFAAPASMQSHFVVFALACVVGFYVITGVSHSLHTPLMSVTNAVSGIIIIGAMLLIGSANPVVAALSFIAMTIASINVFGGFLVTHRMLKMFQGSSED
ncbi:Re/Si-specific NAD(P)(+) transhydrogenase subunit alpha [Xiamenia xianingshaonis]|uniref:proton-translocating NAD(P)(+) transhydrogenase n=1 Tax=Xiamenia xianingshaonis TaxID=2682776 RepID=A0A9E6MPJ6_9ACTN|nr:Re/Si-specific NAD(P)(+) transhydrogenase subunit alpha [Xiamenia xianingshaonis]NHM14896.1 Re/Si-specific NAD(P)(+) transhydrogenase subunit alpha [Xiamenia xianingshaonis]QTU84059.1 Re/Si-specific NAD(P)(+) transhydrogenase subunit alpha [Xiamenia xianingshaonis]